MRAGRAKVSLLLELETLDLIQSNLSHFGQKDFHSVERESYLLWIDWSIWLTVYGLQMGESDFMAGAFVQSVDIDSHLLKSQ